MRSTPQSDAPFTTLWTADEFVRLTAVFVLGVALWVYGTVTSAGELKLADQLTEINLATIGVIVGTAAHVRWFLQGRLRIGQRRAHIIEQRRALLVAPAGVTQVGPAIGPRYRSAILVSGAGLRRYHRSDCALAFGKQWPAAARSVHDAEGRVPCGVCGAST